MTEITVEAFYCPKDDAIVRGKDEQRTPGPDKSVLVTATCSMCGTKVYKTIYPDESVPPAPPATPQPPAPVPQPELVKQVEGTQFPTVGVESQVGTIQRPSPKFWDAYAKAVSMKLPPEFVRNIDTVASLSWYNYLDDKQKQDFIDRFKETGTLEIPDDSFDITRNNPKAEGVSAMSGTEKSAAALAEVSGFARILESTEVMGLAIRFWSAKEYDADYDGIHMSVRLHDWEHTPYARGSEVSRSKGEILSVRATVGGIPIAGLFAQWNRHSKLAGEEESYGERQSKYMKLPPERFQLTLYDAGYYSHLGYKSFIKHPSPVLAAAIQRILMGAPVELGSISLVENRIDSHFPHQKHALWIDSQPFTLIIQPKKLPKGFIKPFWKPPVVRKGKEIVEVPIEERDLDRIQAQIMKKEKVFNKYIEKLYEGDVELGKKLELDPLGVAKLMGDTEYEKLLKQRDEAMWAEEAPEPPESS
jgi:hypothetical protein